MTLSRTTTSQSAQSNHSRHSRFIAAKKIRTNQSFGNATINEAQCHDPLAGQLNHLSPEQADALEAFKDLCTEQSLYTPALDEKGASHDDATLLYERSADIHTSGLIPVTGGQRNAIELC
jgi:hypothetical protein